MCEERRTCRCSCEVLELDRKLFYIIYILRDVGENDEEVISTSIILMLTLNVDRARQAIAADVEGAMQRFRKWVLVAVWHTE